jgi:hypothetical protein
VLDGYPLVSQAGVSCEELYGFRGARSMGVLADHDSQLLFETDSIGLMRVITVSTYLIKLDEKRM